jgi:hypothetical protein
MAIQIVIDTNVLYFNHTHTPQLKLYTSTQTHDKTAHFNTHTMHYTLSTTGEADRALSRLDEHVTRVSTPVRHVC